MNARGKVRSIELVEADAGTFRFPAASYDVLFSRVGVMFFPDPVSAFANMRKALRPGARVARACCRGLAGEPHTCAVLLAAAHRHIAKRPQPAPEEAGMFSFRERGARQACPDRAGFRSIDLEALDIDLEVAAGRGLDAAVETIARAGARPAYCFSARRRRRAPRWRPPFATRLPAILPMNPCGCAARSGSSPRTIDGSGGQRRYARSCARETLERAPAASQSVVCPRVPQTAE